MRAEQGRCGDCRHWDTRWLDPPWGACRAIPHDDEGGLAFTWDHEGYNGGIRTKAEFGCVLWEAQP